MYFLEIARNERLAGSSAGLFPSKLAQITHSSLSVVEFHTTSESPLGEKAQLTRQELIDLAP